jgi:hypothetical protein
MDERTINGDRYRQLGNNEEINSGLKRGNFNNH